MRDDGAQVRSASRGLGEGHWKGGGWAVVRWDMRRIGKMSELTTAIFMSGGFGI